MAVHQAGYFERLGLSPRITKMGKAEDQRRAPAACPRALANDEDLGHRSPNWESKTRQMKMPTGGTSQTRQAQLEF